MPEPADPRWCTALACQGSYLLSDESRHALQDEEPPDLPGSTGSSAPNLQSCAAPDASWGCDCCWLLGPSTVGWRCSLVIAKDQVSCLSKTKPGHPAAPCQPTELPRRQGPLAEAHQICMVLGTRSPVVTPRHPFLLARCSPHPRVPSATVPVLGTLEQGEVMMPAPAREQGGCTSPPTEWRKRGRKAARGC